MGDPKRTPLLDPLIWLVFRVVTWSPIRRRSSVRWRCSLRRRLWCGRCFRSRCRLRCRCRFRRRRGLGRRLGRRRCRFGGRCWFGRRRRCGFSSRWRRWLRCGRGFRRSRGRREFRLGLLSVEQEGRNNQGEHDAAQYDGQKCPAALIAVRHETLPVANRLGQKLRNANQ